MRVPLLDLRAQHEQVAAEVHAGLARLFETSAYILGAPVAEFEAAFARFSSAAHCIGVSNGTDALELALRAIGVGTGDEVILPANSFIATALAVMRAGATPVLVDADPVYHLIDVAAVERAIGPRTRAIMPVHLYGQVAPMEPLLATAAAAGVAVIEDAAQAQGATQNGRSAGTFGAAAGTSFYPGKNLGAYGDAGAVLTQSDAVAAKVRALRNYGSELKYHHPEIGFNARLDTLQAIVLNAKLKHLAAWNTARRTAAQRYNGLLTGIAGITLPATLPGNEHIWHLYVVRVPQRERVLQRLHAAGIGAGIHYPTPIHLQGAFAHLGYGSGDFPASERAAAEVLSLPIYPEITHEQQELVVTELRTALA